ncbi:MAG: hypothetical protein M0024_13320 [Nitrospiraceae bacterium]|nr:hypothetical protein [Nitrospiraceae bacterium]
MKKGKGIAAGILALTMAGSFIASDAVAWNSQGRGGGQGQGQGLRLRDGSCLNPRAGIRTNQPGQGTYGSGNAVRPLNGTGRGYGDGTQPRPQDGTGFGPGATGK